MPPNTLTTRVPELTSPAERRQSLVQAAFEIISADGFEGLRTRSVAARVGINIATLHYYFPTKEALIGGVAEYLSGQFRSLHGPTPAPSGSVALDRLHQEFSDLRFYRTDHHDLAVVMVELQLRGRRDEKIANVVDPLIGHWQGSLREMVKIGIEEGVFRANLDPGAAGFLLASAFSSAATQRISVETLDGLFNEIECWLTAQPRRAG